MQIMKTEKLEAIRFPEMLTFSICTFLTKSLKQLILKISAFLPRFVFRYETKVPKYVDTNIELCFVISTVRAMKMMHLNSFCT